MQPKRCPACLRLQRRDPEDHLHHKCRRIAEPCAAENAEDQGFFPDRGGRHEADLPGYPQLRKGRPRCPGMGCGPQSAGHNVHWAFRRLTVSDNRVAPIRYTDFQTLPDPVAKGASNGDNPKSWLAAIQSRVQRSCLVLPDNMASQASPRIIELCKRLFSFLRRPPGGEEHYRKRCSLMGERRQTALFRYRMMPARLFAAARNPPQ